MSDNFVTFVPENPQFVPTEAQIAEAIAGAAKLFPNADLIEPRVWDGVQLFDAGSNFEAIYCPGCGQEIPAQWWQDAMGSDYEESGFRLEPQRMPCCESSYTLNDLRYDWPQAFGRFGLSIQNPNIGRISTEAVAALETALGIRLRIIYQHL